MNQAPLSPARAFQNLIFTSGQLGKGDDGAIVAGGIEAQSERALHNLANALSAHGADLGDVIKVTAWLTDPDHAVAFNAAYVKAFAQPFPARSTVIAALIAPGAMVEVEAIACCR